MSSRPRVVVAGLGDSGLLTAIKLAKHADVVGISARPGLVSGQELGTRLAWPEHWQRDYWIDFSRYRGLRDVRVVHGTLTGVDERDRAVRVRLADGTATREHFDAMVVATGVSNGFWRHDRLQSSAEVAHELADAHQRFAKASRIAVIGGGAAAVSSAINLATRFTDAQVDLYFPGERPLPSHHGRVWAHLAKRATGLGLGIHPGHRAVLPENVDTITSGPIEWSTGQDPSSADAVLWAIGRVRPHTDWLPRSLLTDEGFVRADEHLRVPGTESVFTIGDVAATDPLRSTARNRADGLLAHNVRAFLEGGSMKTYRPPKRRWGSVIGVQDDGLTVYTASGRPMRFPSWSVDTVLMPLIVRRGIYRGIGKPSEL